MFLRGFTQKININTEINLNNGETLNTFIHKISPFFKNTLQLKILFKITGDSNLIKRGDYIFRGEYDVFDIRKKLLRGGKLELRKVSLIPGERLRDIKDHINADIEEVSGKNIYKYEFLKLFNNIQGLLATDTFYVNAEDKSDEKVIELALEKFNKDYYLPYKDKKAGMLDFKKAIILASIVEKEAKTKEEKAMIAGVFINRLRKGMKLESCATVQYLFDKPKKRLWYKDLEVVSPYNTYLNAGLPPTPICFFSIDTLRSVYNFKEHQYLYFVLEGNGRHHFSKTLAEHNRVKESLK